MPFSHSILRHSFRLFSLLCWVLYDLQLRFTSSSVSVYSRHISHPRQQSKKHNPLQITCTELIAMTYDWIRSSADISSHSSSAHGVFTTQQTLHPFSRPSAGRHCECAGALAFCLSLLARSDKPRLPCGFQEGSTRAPAFRTISDARLNG